MDYDKFFFEKGSVIQLNVKPSVGRVVHYVSYGTPGGEFTSECRAAVVTAVDETDPELVSLCVLNPTGIFFHSSTQNELAPWKGGTWHWPERVE